MSLTIGGKKARTHITPTILNIVCARAALFADVLATAAAIFAVIVVPMFSPSTMATASLKSIRPDAARSIVMAIVALEAWRTIVRTAPAMRKRRIDPKPNPLMLPKKVIIPS